MRSIYTYIEQAPVRCAEMLERSNDLVEDLVDQYCGEGREYRRILLVASGSSYNIAQTARSFLQRILGVEVSVTWPMSYIHYDHMQGEGTFVICMTQSGRSTNTIEAVRRANLQGNSVVVLTANANSPVRASCSHVYEYGAGMEDYYVGKGFPTSCMFLALFALSAAERLGRDVPAGAMDSLEKMAEILVPVYEQSRTFCRLIEDELVRMRRAMVIGVGPGYGVAREGALKLNEMTGLAVNAYESEEFLHGPTYEIRKDHAVFVVDQGGICSQRLWQEFDALGSLTDHVFMVTNVPGCPTNHVLRLPSCGVEELNAVIDVVPFQVMAEHICDALDLLSYNLSNYDFEQRMKTKA